MRLNDGGVIVAIVLIGLLFAADYAGKKYSPEYSAARTQVVDQVNTVVDPYRTPDDAWYGGSNPYGN